MTFITIILAILIFIFGLIIGFFLSFYFIIRRRVKEKQKIEQVGYGVQPSDVDNFYNL